MYEDYENGDYPGQLNKRQMSSTVSEPATTERRTMNRWQFRADQVQMLNQQVQMELIISLLFSVIVTSVFWDSAPHALLIGWASAVVVSVGVRSLFISGRSSNDNANDFNIWGQQYITGAAVSGMCWGSLGIISSIYGDLTQQLFVLVLLAGMSLTAFVSMQSSPRTISAFLIPALLPATALFLYQGTTLSLAIGTVVIIFAAVMLFSSRTMRNILSKSFSLGSHNTDLIKKLVITRESAEESRKHAEQMNLK